MCAHAQLIRVEVEITFVTASAYRAVPLKGNAAHIPVYTVITQTESARQLFAA